MSSQDVSTIVDASEIAQQILGKKLATLVFPKVKKIKRKSTPDRFRIKLLMSKL